MDKDKILKELDNFTLAYIEAALWSSTDESTEDGGEPLDKNYDLDDIADETLAKIIKDCKEFQEKYADLLDCEPSTRYPKDEQAGHDFWLTRNGHGCGFWDGDWPEPQATKLTEASKKFGECWLYVGDDNLIYL